MPTIPTLVQFRQQEVKRDIERCESPIRNSRLHATLAWTARIMDVRIAPAVDLEDRERTACGRASYIDTAVVGVEGARAWGEGSKLSANLAACNGVDEAATDGYPAVCLLLADQIPSGVYAPGGIDSAVVNTPVRTQLVEKVRDEAEILWDCSLGIIGACPSAL